MDAEERVRRVGHRVDEAVHEAFALRDEPVVLAAEGHDHGLALVAGLPGEAVGLEPGADDQPVELERLPGGASPGRSPGPVRSP